MGAWRNTHTAPHWHNICRGWGAAIRFGMVIAYIIFFCFFAFLLLTARQKSPIVFLRTAAKGAAGRAALRGGHCAHNAP